MACIHSSSSDSDPVLPDVKAALCEWMRSARRPAAVARDPTKLASYTCQASLLHTGMSHMVRPRDESSTASQQHLS